MKTMKDFAAQQLSKKQMNEVMGGQQMITEDLLLCWIYDGDCYIGCNYVIRQYEPDPARSFGEWL